MVEISKIVKSDLQELSSLFFELTGENTDFAKMNSNYEWIDENENYILLGARNDGKLVGSLMGIICRDLVGECRPFMVIENVIVSSGFRGKGIGKKLMIEIEDIAKRNNCYYIMFVSGAQRTDAHAFYKSIGYGLDQVQGFKKYVITV